jgi:hypothetical protein
MMPMTATIGRIHNTSGPTELMRFSPVLVPVAKATIRETPTTGSRREYRRAVKEPFTVFLSGRQTALSQITFYFLFLAATLR